MWCLVCDLVWCVVSRFVIVCCVGLVGLVVGFGVLLVIV